MSKDIFDGKFFLSFDKDGVVSSQGHIRQKVGSEKYYVEFFEWLFGDLSYAKLVSVGDMVGWKFYSTEKAWRTAGHNALLILDRQA